MKITDLYKGRAGLLPPLPSFIVGWAFPEIESDSHCLISLDRMSCLPQVGSDGESHVRGEDFLSVLMENGLIRTCMNLQEGKNIADNEYRLRCFGGAHLLLWRSTAYDNTGNHFVPFVQNIPGQPSYVKPVIGWYWLEYFLYKKQRTYVFV